MDDPFEAAYLAGVPEALPAPSVATRPRGATPTEPFALTGCVVTPDVVLDPGCVVVADGEVSAVQATPPDGVRVQDTGGVICPGLIDLHGHPEFNVFAAWEPPKEFANRYQWRESDLYHKLVRDPQNTLKTALPDQTQLRYAEVRALVGGVTAIQGTSELITRLTAESLVRNVDKWIFGRHRARALIDLPSATGRAKQQLDDILAGIDQQGDVDAFYIHLAEGQTTNARSQGEFDKLVGLERPDARHRDHPRHGAHQGPARACARRRRQARLVAAEQPAALRRDDGRGGCAGHRGCRSASAPTGCRAGARACWRRCTVARRCLIEQGHAVEAKQLVQMVTTGAAAIAGLADKLGHARRRAAGRPRRVRAPPPRRRTRTSSRPSRHGSSS